MTSARVKAIYTLGTSTHSPEEFVQLLSSHQVEVVIDVRRFPTSRWEHFGKNELVRRLDAVGIDYIWLGEELGGYRRGGYQVFTTTTDFQTGVSKLEEIAQQRRVVIICAERFPWRCHRRFIGFELEKRGWQVTHIINGKD